MSAKPLNSASYCDSAVSIAFHTFIVVRCHACHVLSIVRRAPGLAYCTASVFLGILTHNVTHEIQGKAGSERLGERPVNYIANQPTIPPLPNYRPVVHRRSTNSSGLSVLTHVSHDFLILQLLFQLSTNN
jgi:hypothetical protein